MAANERFEESIGTWLQEAAPSRLPERVLAATFERTRRTRQDPDLRAILGRRQMPRLVPALGTAAAVLLATVLALNVGVITGPAGTPSPSASASAQPISGSMWPQSTLEEVRAAQTLADAGDPRYTWQLEDLSLRIGNGGPYREEFYRRFLEEVLGWEDFQWTLGGGIYVDLPGVYFLRCRPGPTSVFVGDGECMPTIDESRYELVHLNVAQLDRQGLTGIWVVTDWELLQPYEPAPPPPADVVEFLNGFLAARVAGDGAEEFLVDPEEVPLLYATTTGSPYERAGFSEIHGYEWPYGLKAYSVWLEVDGLVVVNQLFFMDPNGRRVLDYIPDGFGTDLRPTNEEGRAVAAAFNAFDGEVTLYIAHPWVFFEGASTIKLVPGSGSRVAPTTDGGERNGWERLRIMTDPRRNGADCPAGPDPTDAAGLAESFLSDPGLEATLAGALSAGGTPDWTLNVRIAAGAVGGCLGLVGDTDGLSLGTGDRMRLYLFDAPVGLSMRVVAIAIVVPESRFEYALGFTPPVIEFHVP